MFTVINGIPAPEIKMFSVNDRQCFSLTPCSCVVTVTLSLEQRLMVPVFRMLINAIFSLHTVVVYSETWWPAYIRQPDLSTLTARSHPSSRRTTTRTSTPSSNHIPSPRSTLHKSEVECALICLCSRLLLGVHGEGLHPVF